MAVWSACRTGISAIPVSNPTNKWPLAWFVLSHPELKSSATLVNRQLATSCQLGFLILLCCMYFEWSAYKLAGYFFCALSTVNKPLNLFFKLFRSGLCHQYRIYVVVSQMSFCGETSDTNTKFWLFSHKFIVWNHKMISAILLLLKSCFCVLYGSHIHHY